MNNIELKFEFSIESEIKRVENTLAKINWYKKNGYKPYLPNDRANIKSAVIKEYDGALFNKVSIAITRDWNNFSGDLATKLASINLKYEPIYKVKLTKYGVSGSYNLPNKIVLNVREKGTKDLIRTIIHEIIHLAIEDLIIKFKVSHWQKERLVDLICGKLSFDVRRTQDLPSDAYYIDKSFKKHYPNIVEILNNL